MCYCGCSGENYDGDCIVRGRYCKDEDEDCRELEDIEPTEQETADAEDRYFGF